MAVRRRSGLKMRSSRQGDGAGSRESEQMVTPTPRRRPITTESIGSVATHPSLRGALATKQSRGHNMRGASNPDGRTAAPGLLRFARNDGQGIGSLVSACRLSSPLGPTKRYRIWRLHLLNRLAIRRRRETQRPTEQAVHVALVRKPAVGGDALERNVLAGELPFGVLEPSLDDVGMRRAAKVDVKFSSKVETAQLDQVCELGQRDVALDVVLDVLHDEALLSPRQTTVHFRLA